ncbi:MULTISPECIES: hypothetical protein [Roseomonadaceae]|uniref:PepSY domain-containing protein n=1 Tax=Falsiroseomonas oleicola TaxID=2801474 RepID=A0ABS6HD05_9PROT|nr:hypothetical protein [Roseomonas oleicola]MBU8545200.1 hypothetical protein [Roseomonas oleicola]
MTTRHTALVGAFVASLGLAGAAFAQSTSPSATTPNVGPTGQPMAQQGTSGQTPGAPAAQTNPTPMPQGSQANQAPGMGGARAPSSQMGQTSPGATPSDPGRAGGGLPGATQPTTPAPGAAPSTGTTTPTAPVQGGGDTARQGALEEGANSFTEGQARSRMGDAGFADVQGLTLDDRGIWRGRAMRNGQQTGVGMDFQGNIVATP